MCSYGSFARNAGGTMNPNLRKKADQEPDRPRGLNLLEKRLGLSTRKEDLEFVITAQKGLVDSLGDILAHQIGDRRRPSSINVIVRVGSRASGKPSSALHEASKHGNVECCRLLLDHGASVNLKLELSRVVIPIHYAKTPQVCQVLLEAGSFSKRQRSDKRLPDMASYARTQKREEVAAVIDEWNVQLKKKMGRRKRARANLQMIWDRLNGMVIGLRRIREYQLQFTEKFYSPDYGGFMKVAGARFHKMARRYDDRDEDSDENDDNFNNMKDNVNAHLVDDGLDCEKKGGVEAVIKPVIMKDADQCVGSGLKAAILLRKSHQPPSSVIMPTIYTKLPSDQNVLCETADQNFAEVLDTNKPPFKNVSVTMKITPIKKDEVRIVSVRDAVQKLVEEWYVNKKMIVLKEQFF